MPEGNFTKKEPVAQVFSCKFCKISENTFFIKHFWATASFYSVCWILGEVLSKVLFFRINTPSNYLVSYVIADFTETKRIDMVSQIYLRSFIFETIHEEVFSNIMFLRFYAEVGTKSCHWQKGVLLHLRSNIIKNTHEVVYFLVKLHL